MTIEDPRDPWTKSKARKLNYRFGLAEGICNILGEYPADFILAINSQMKHFQNQETGTWDGNYPARLKNWPEFIVNLLKKDPDSRRAVMPIYGQPDRKADSLDICCTLTLQFLLREGKLNMIVNMRSNDALLGLPNDVVQFSLMQQTIASCLGVPVGWYKHNVGSLHIYERDHDRIMEVIHDKETVDRTFPVFPETMMWSSAYAHSKYLIERFAAYREGKRPETMNHWFSEPWLSIWKVLTKQS